MTSAEIKIRIATEADAERIGKVLERYPYLVAEQEGVPVGYAYAGLFHSRAAYQWGVETSVYVDRSCKRAGAFGKPAKC